MVLKGGRRSASDVREEVSRLTAARDALDAEQAERRRREDSAFARYAEGTARATAIAAERDGELARLDAERVRAQQRADERLGEVESEQAAVLAELNSDGRSAEDLAAMFGLPVKRVRSVLRAAKDSDRTADGGRPEADTATGGGRVDDAAVPVRTPDNGAAPDATDSPVTSGAGADNASATAAASAAPVH